MPRLTVALLLFAVPAAAADKTAQELAEQVRPSLCAITTRGRDAGERGLGTGFVVSADGLIATAAHVVGEGRPIAVEFPDGTKYDVTAVHAYDHKRDVAVVKIDAKGLKPLDLGDSDA